MENKKILRLDLREQTLKTESAKAVQEVNIWANKLRNLRKAKISAEKSWRNELNKALSRCNANSASEQKILFSNCLSKLKTLSAEMQQHRLQEKQHLGKLGETIKLYRTKDKQLQECKSKKEAIELRNQALSEQVETEEIGASRYAEQCDSLNKIPCPNNNPEKIDRTVATILPEISSAKDLRNIPALFITERQTVIVNEKRANSDSWNSRLSQYQVVEECNRALKVNCCQSASGTHLSVDYLLKPGHLLSVQAYKANQSKAVEVQIESSSSEDRRVLLSNRENLENYSKARVKIL